ncbi:IclR family transcriptional regulator [Demequina lignilytica]|uniref:IclR family transcriptional regulator n=1 Tax=Demequina lignilytica TaxID=3051663 RepID=A0AAW7M9A4_9MICO|nr:MULTISPECIES: IclR family transcriptional regulator [unclassified Demequina]MDN4479164.1 IclR family transcriptional regulator [Demequina sp. SYSU T00039-1]MDN4482601.1 IclR family transcriptional regulator [Demequina sp. SYSU T0a273]MDN4489123.1 IclR family transcriptional regulator [Demequina sp. SYSU T00039]MDN4490226.1 IclR family transcriptional regulator [Demequina sp. SYSU T00068]
MARGSAGRSALSRHLRVLGAFGPLTGDLTLSEIAAAAALPLSTAHRLVAELAEEGLLEPVGDRRYRPGLRLWELATRTPGAAGLRELARPWMGVVHARLRQHIQLGVLSGHDVLFIERLSAPDAVVNATLIGARIALPLSSSGLVLLAHAPEALLDEVAAGHWSRPTARAIADARELRARVADARRDGYAVLDGAIHEASRGIAVPVIDSTGRVHAALGAVVPIDETPVRPAIELLTVAAAGIARSLEATAGGAAARPGRPLRPLLATSRATLAYFEELGVDTVLELRAHDD